MINLELIKFLLQNGLQDKKHPSRVADLAIIVEAIHERIASEISLKEIEGKIYTDYSASQIRDRIPYLVPSSIGKRLKTLEANNIIESQVFYVDRIVNSRYKTAVYYRRISNQQVLNILSGGQNNG
jgi:DNA-binding HxlR family transcriptional regulator